MGLGGLFAGLLLGLSLAAPPGPMNALIARESSRHGWGHGLRVGVAAPIADTVYLVALLAGYSFLLVDPVVPRGAAAAGSLLMLYFAWSTARAKASDAGGRKASFWAAFAMAMANPFQITWWLTTGFSLLLVHGKVGLAGFLLGIFGWVTGFSFLVARGAERWAWFVPFVTVASADLLFGSACYLVLLAAGVV